MEKVKKQEKSRFSPHIAQAAFRSSHPKTAKAYPFGPSEPKQHTNGCGVSASKKKRSAEGL